MTRTQSLWNHGVKIGVIGGISALVIALVGMVESFNKRFVIADVITSDAHESRMSHARRDDAESSSG